MSQMKTEVQWDVWEHVSLFFGSLLVLEMREPYWKLGILQLFAE